MYDHMAIKMTFSLDDETATRLRRAAERLEKPMSEVVREAVHLYYARLGRLSDTERDRMLSDFDRLVAGIPERPLADTEAELVAVREARRAGGRQTPAE